MPPDGEQGKRGRSESDSEKTVGKKTAGEDIVSEEVHVTDGLVSKVHDEVQRIRESGNYEEFEELAFQTFHKSLENG